MVKLTEFIKDTKRYCPFCEIKGQKVELKGNKGFLMCPNCMAYEVDVNDPESYDKTRKKKR